MRQTFHRERCGKNSELRAAKNFAGLSIDRFFFFFFGGGGVKGIEGSKGSRGFRALGL